MLNVIVTLSWFFYSTSSSTKTGIYPYFINIDDFCESISRNGNMDLLWVFCLSQIKECPEDMSRNDRNDQNYTLECRVKSIRWLFLHWIVLFFDEKRGKSILEFNSFFKKFVNEYCMYLYILVIKQAWSSVYWVYSFIILYGQKKLNTFRARIFSSSFFDDSSRAGPLPSSPSFELLFHRSVMSISDKESLFPSSLSKESFFFEDVDVTATCEVVCLLFFSSTFFHLLFK